MPGYSVNIPPLAENLGSNEFIGGKTIFSGWVRFQLRRRLFFITEKSINCWIVVLSNRG